MVKLNDFGANRRAAAIGHNQAVKAQRHTGATLDPAGRFNAGKVAVHPRIPEFPLVNDGCTERIADLGINAGQRVI
jgi:hypothetical protein